MNYFKFFSLPQQFNVDLSLLETNFRAIQSASHPDRFVTCTSAEKIASMQTATLANEAYLTLKNPANRAKYLLLQQGIDAIDEKNTQMAADFLMQQLEWRETLDDAKHAKDLDTLENLLAEMQTEANILQDDLADYFDEKQDNVAATDTTRKLIFIDKVCADIHKAIEHLE
ncbi:MAG: Fe-S protein assembly co-chaperone HscB [Bdellovibrio sp.]|nr:Fe-S protein assembly co-chaperone HscB [Methylotenera sp.]